jgi:hypothetical protein
MCAIIKTPIQHYTVIIHNIITSDESLRIRKRVGHV